MRYYRASFLRSAHSRLGDVAKAGLTHAKRSEDGSALGLCNEEDEDAVTRIRRQTHTGRPCGTPAFLTRLESLLGRIVGPNQRGRKKKTAGVEDIKG